jgi:parallel beta-helix repeat protein
MEDIYIPRNQEINNLDKRVTYQCKLLVVFILITSFLTFIIFLFYAFHFGYGWFRLNYDTYKLKNNAAIEGDLTVFFNINTTNIYVDYLLSQVLYVETLLFPGGITIDNKINNALIENRKFHITQESIVNNTEYQRVASFIYDKNFYNATALIKCNASNQTIGIRIYDVTNNQVIASVVSSNTTENQYMMLNMGTIQNLPLDFSTFQIEVKRIWDNGTTLGIITFYNMVFQY